MNMMTRPALLMAAIVVAMGCADSAAGDFADTRLAQLEKSAAPAAPASAKDPRGAESREKEKRHPEKEKIRTRSIQTDHAVPETTAPLEKAPSIDADAQKGLVDRMKGCCDAPKN